MTKAQAYDISRKEFYALRHEEEIERRVAKEEATWTGAYFGKTVLDIGMHLEDQVYEGWKKWATMEVQTMDRARDAAYTSIPEADEDVSDNAEPATESEDKEAVPA